MEDSFADFQKKKKIKAGPKVDPKNKKKNQKKSLKCSKGQKDIRTLIKKNELVSYSHEFDQVCKESGVDVDAEQLQLAIALSKSLNDIQSTSEEIETENKQLSSQERSAKIRTTLQEYGFKGINSKMLSSLSTNKRKKYTKNPKLLLISSEEKQQEIAHKYSQVLASNICELSNESSKCSYVEHTIFYKATNIPYEIVKNDEAFYVSNLIDKPTHRTCLLKDWSEIPGRPVSPKPIHNDINFETVQYSQDELDNILSGSVDIAQNVVNSKLNENKIVIADPSDDSCIKNDTIITIDLTPFSNISENNKSLVSKMSETDKSTEIQVVEIQDSEEFNFIKDNVQENIECIDLVKDISFKNNSRKSLKVIDSLNLNSYQFRSASPDLFDDEVSCIIEDKNSCSAIDTNEVCSNIEDKNVNSTNDSISKYDNCGTILMDLTECANNYSNVINTDITKRKSNDLMDLTQCVDVKSQNIIDVISSSGETNDNKVEENVELVDLTQVSNVVYSSPEMDKRGTKISNSFVHSDDTIIYDNNVFTNENENIDLQDPIVLDDESTKIVVNREKLSDNIVDESNHNSCETDNENINSQNNIDNVEFEYNNHDDININSQNNIDNVQLEYNNHDDININSQNNIDNVEFEYNNHDDININSQNNIDNVQLEYNNHDDININSQNNIDNVEFEYNNYINLSQVSARSDDLPNYPEYKYDDRELESLEQNSGANTNNDKDNDIISLKSVSFNNDIENPDEYMDLTQDSEKSLDTAENDVINCPGTSYSVSEHLDNNVGKIDNQNNSILSVDNVAVISDFVGENNEDDKIDLTQATEEVDDETIATGYSYVQKNNSKLGKINNISIDYDEMFDEITSEYKNVSKNSSKNSSSEKDVNGSNPSINSEVFEISDRELNYSIHHSIHENIDIDIDNIVGLNRSLSESHVPTANMSKLSPIKEKNHSHPNTPIKINKDVGDAIIQTPKNNEYIIKTREVTPMADYEGMTTPEINEELEKYGLKPFKRKRAIQLLTYVYNQTHPVIENCSPEEGPSKRLKRDNKYSSPKKNSKSPKKCLHFGSDVNKENDIFIVTKEIPDIKNIECDPTEWFFQNREKAKVHSCRVPLHIAFHNYVSCRRLLQEAILRYEPVNIDVIHKDLVNDGHKYNPKDLLKFMDRKCITVKTVENNLRNKK